MKIAGGLRVAALLTAVSLIGCEQHPTDPGSIETARSGGPGGAGVLPAGSRPFGMTYGQWAGAWWQWAYGIPVPTNPLFDETGDNCGVGQQGPVWFLAGVFNTSGTAVRDNCVVPAGRALFIPILNAECSNVEGNGATADLLQACAQGILDGAASLALEVDGRPVQNLEAFRAHSGGVGLELPDDNLLQLFGYDAPAGHCMPGSGVCVPYLSVADGFHVMLAPLPVGSHTIHFHAELPAFGFALDLTYHLRVAPQG